MMIITGNMVGLTSIEMMAEGRTVAVVGTVGSRGVEEDTEQDQDDLMTETHTIIGIEIGMNMGHMMTLDQGADPTSPIGI
jgi:hypothetical protein